MRTLQVIETVQELSDLFKSGKLGKCVVQIDYDEVDDFLILKLNGSDDYCIAENFVKTSTEFIEELLHSLGIPSRS